MRKPREVNPGALLYLYMPRSGFAVSPIVGHYQESGPHKENRNPNHLLVLSPTPSGYQCESAYSHQGESQQCWRPTIHTCERQRFD